MLPIIWSEFVQRKLFARLAQLDVNYRGNTLSWHFNSLSINTVLKAGDRAPDIAFRQRDKITTLFELLRPFLAIALVRFDGNDTRTADDATVDVIRRVQADGTCWVGGATWFGQQVMRISISNWSTQEEDIDRSADAIVACYRALQSRT